NCNLYKAWYGGVKFDGPVYTCAHGPQPTSEGGAYVTQDPDGHTWFLDGKPATVRWKGYRLQGTKATLLYDIIDGRQTYRIEETPEAIGERRLSRVVRLFGSL